MYYTHTSHYLAIFNVLNGSHSLAHSLRIFHARLTLITNKPKKTNIKEIYFYLFWSLLSKCARNDNKWKENETKRNHKETAYTVHWHEGTNDDDDDDDRSVNRKIIQAKGKRRIQENERQKRMNFFVGLIALIIYFALYVLKSDKKHNTFVINKNERCLPSKFHSECDGKSKEK